MHLMPRGEEQLYLTTGMNRAAQVEAAGQYTDGG